MNMTKYERGQVWKLWLYKNSEIRGHEQSLARPWLVLSLGVYNNSSGMITAVPITSQDKHETPAHVDFVNDKGEKNTILCEQIRSFDTNFKDYRFDYLGTLSPEIMEKVDVALSIHQGLHYSPVTLKSLYDTMESIVKSVTHMEQQSPKFTDKDIIDFTAELKEFNQTPTIITTSESEINDSLSEVSATQEIVPETIAPVEPKEKSKRIRWDEETIKEFLNDTETKPMKEVMKKWNISQKTRYYSMKNYVKTLLMKKS